MFLIQNHPLGRRMFKTEQNFVMSFKVGKAYFNRIQIPDKAALYNTEESIELSKQEFHKTKQKHKTVVRLGVV